MTREEYLAERAARGKPEETPTPTPTQEENDLFRLGLIGLDEKTSSGTAPPPHVATAAPPRR